MATTTITVPMNGNEPKRRAFIYNVSAEIAAGNDIIFKDENGNEVNVTRIGCTADGKIKFRSVGQGDHEALQRYFIAGGLHQGEAIHKIFVADTESGKNFIVKL